MDIVAEEVTVIKAVIRKMNTVQNKRIYITNLVSSPSIHGQSETMINYSFFQYHRLIRQGYRGG